LVPFGEGQYSHHPMPNRQRGEPPIYSAKVKVMRAPLADHPIIRPSDDSTIP
jgi:hypothetical protein